MHRALKIFIHAIFWLVFTAFSFAISYGKSVREWAYISNLTPHMVINLVWAAIVFYLFYFYFIRFFERKQFVRYLVFSLLVSLLLTLLMFPLHSFFYPQFRYFDIRFMLPPMAGTFILAQCGSLVRGFENWFAGIQLKNELETRNLKNELELLKSQINPHFLFNALNNIDALIMTKPEKASESLLSLSQMLRYMIYETGTDRVPLQKELVYLGNYINLQQLRFRETDYVKIDLPRECGNASIAPMILIAFVENAFKHAHQVGKFPVIDIKLQCTQVELFFVCRNHYRSDHQHAPGGIGLENARRRLEILYPGKHELAIFDEESVFRVELKIQFT